MKIALKLASICALLALFTTGALAQGVRYDNIVIGPTGHAIGGATITVCTSSATGTPCSPTTPIYTDATLGTTTPSSFQADQNGNYGFWIAPGTYKLTITGTGITPQTMTITPGCIPGATGCSSGGSGTVATGTVGNCAQYTASTTVGSTGSPCGTGGSSLNINGAAVSNPNLNSTSPAPDSGYVAATMKVLGSDAIAETPSPMPNDAFYVSTACGGKTNCLQWVDDDATDNCGAATTAFLAAINAYAGPGEPQLIIEGSGTGKAYKLATAGCHIELDIPTVVHDFATIDCAQVATTANCVQFSPNNLVAQVAIPKFDWDGGVFIGGANLTNSLLECEPFTTNCVIKNVEFHNSGAGHTTGGSCTNWSILYDPNVFEGTAAYNQWDQNDSVVGRCGFFNNGAAGENTIFFAHNVMGGAQGIGIPPTICSNVGIFEGGYYGGISYNNLYGFNADIRTIGVGTRIDHNTLDSAECTLGGVNAVIQYGAAGAASSVDTHSIEQNNVQGAHVTYLLAKAGDTGASTIKDFTMVGNQSSAGGPTNVIDSSPCLISNVLSGTACYQADNVHIIPALNAGWCLASLCGQFFQGSNAANISAVTVVNTPYGTSWLVTCSVVMTRAATTSSTLPTCSIGWIDQATSVAQTAAVTPTWASGAIGCSGSTTNTVGNSCVGSTAVFAKTTTNITVTTSGYASSGATTMQYQVLVQVFGH